MISVCIATHNGEQFIIEQLDSILKQIEFNDEIIISDDNSNDNTVEIIKNINDQRIKIYTNNFSNLIRNFEFLINISKGDIIFLCDQDDIWDERKISFHIESYKKVDYPLLVLSDVMLIDEYGAKLMKSFYSNKFTDNFFVNLYKNNFIGCSISFNKELKKYILPFPKNIPMHDWWIGIVAITFGNTNFIESKLTYYRRHSGNFTNNINSSLLLKLKWRLSLFINILHLFIKRKFK